ncbi:MAG: P1 family peptidase [Mycobacteriales bacterium]
MRIGSLPAGPHDAITDVPGVRVGYRTLISGDAVRTGVTVVLPHDGDPYQEPLFAGSHVLNGNGELTGMAWMAESGLLMSPIAITNTHAVGVVRDALVAHEVRERGRDRAQWLLPVVGETWDGVLNDTSLFAVRPEHVWEALETASDGPIAQGNVGGGTGMICHDFKGGTGTASRLAGGYTVGVLLQANHGRRGRLTIGGVPVGARIGPGRVPLPVRPAGFEPGGGSVIGVVATDAPLLPHQCRRLAQRVALGIGRTGGVGENSSGDLFVCFSTAHRGELADEPVATVSFLANPSLTPLFDAVVEATEQAVVHALVHARTLTGRDGNTAYAIPHDLLSQVVE